MSTERPDTRLAITRTFCFWIVGRQRVSTLFPYTTLFRSWVSIRPGTIHLPAARTVSASAGTGQPERAPAHAMRPLRVTTDRKSTRLNSSHVEISYAVLCLKKKNRWVGVIRDVNEHTAK